jgi:hypothetical protein
MGQPDDGLLGLGRDLGAQRLLLGVSGTGEEEVLADHQAELVGQVVEVLRLVDPATPDPQEVDVRVASLGSRAAYRSRSTRVTKASSGIQFTPRTKTGVSLTITV